VRKLGIVCAFRGANILMPPSFCSCALRNISVMSEAYPSHSFRLVRSV